MFDLYRLANVFYHYLRDEDPEFFSTDPDPAQLRKKKLDPDPIYYY